MPTLSKSKIIAYRQCPKRLWLEVHRPELRVDSAATQASFQVGQQVGEIARQIYDPAGDGVCIDITKDGFKAAFEQSARACDVRRDVRDVEFQLHRHADFPDDE
jgi:hypothetical protein